MKRKAQTRKQVSSYKRNSCHEGRNQKYQMGSSSTVCSEASTGVGLGSGTLARPPPLSTRWDDPWVPRKLELQGWIPDFTQKNIQGIPDSPVMILR